MIGDYLRFSIKSLKVRKLRTALTMIGIFIGIAAVVALISLGQGMQEAINDQFQKLGVNRVIINPGGGAFGPQGAALAVSILTEEDKETVGKVRGVEGVFGIYGETADVEFRGQTEFLQVWGVPTNSEDLEFLSEISFFDIGEGRELKSGDKFDAILGYNIATQEFYKEIRAGDTVNIKGQKFRVVGVQKKAGTGIHDLLIRIPLDTAREMFDQTEKLTAIMTKTSLSEETAVVADRIEKELRKFRGVEEGEEDFSVETSEEAIRQLTSLLDTIQIFLVGIAAISLLVGGIGIMNTMYTSVLERTREIGIMKAVGARNSHILGMFLVESGFLGLSGGTVGIVLGLIMSKMTEIVALNLGAPDIFRASFSPYLIFGALLFSFLVGTVSGLAPAYQASKMNPVDAIRRR